MTGLNDNLWAEEMLFILGKICEIIYAKPIGTYTYQVCCSSYFNSRCHVLVKVI